MSGELVQARVDLRWVINALTVLRNPDLRPAWRLARAPARQDIRDHVKRRSAEDGAWPARSPLTQRKAGTGTGKAKRPRKVLGRLPSALTSKVSRMSLLLASKAKWAQVQRAGGRAGYGANIPGRDWLWISTSSLEHVSAIISACLREIFEKA